MATTGETSPTADPVKYVTAAGMIDCTGAPPKKDPVVVLRGKRIDKIGTKQTIAIPPDADVVDCGTCTLLPGLMDIHLHTMMFNCLTFHNHRVAQWKSRRASGSCSGCFMPSSASTWASPRCATSG